MLNIQNYTKRFGDKIAVDNLSLHIAAGRFARSSDTTARAKRLR